MIIAPKMANRNLAVTSFIWIFIFLRYEGVQGNSNEGYTLLPSYDLCNPNTAGYYPPTVYLGDVNATTEVYINWSAVNRTLRENCFVLFKSCLSCQITVEPVGDFFYSSFCSKSVAEFTGTCVSRCLYFHIFDADYKSQTSLTFTKSSELVDYSTTSRQLHVIACGEQIYGMEVSMRLRLSVKRKETVFNLDRWYRSQTVRSPYFPEPYTLNNEEYTYEFRAREDSYISLLFTDWLMSPHSYIKFYNANIIGEISGGMRRPHILSTGPYMTMIFNTGPIRNTGIRYGFRGVARFHATQLSIPNILTDCDKFVTSTPGGTLQLEQLHKDGQIRDCIWVIRKASEYEQIRINIVRLRLGTVGQEEIEIMDGLTSRGHRKLYSNGAIMNSGDVEKASFDSPTGFYIHLQGRYSYLDEVVISYSSYNYGISSCPRYSSTFKCDNNLCIEDFLKCDGYDHCGDNSDEDRVLCGYRTDSSGRSSSSNNISVGVIIPIVVSVVLVLAMCLVIIFVRRCRKMSNETYGSAQSRRHSRGHRRHRRGRNVQMSVTVTSGEHPPSYNEVMQTSPIGQLNMAFSWSGAGSALTQPPSYEEAIADIPPELLPATETEQARNAQSAPAPHEEINERAIDLGHLEAFNSLLAPNSYVSSSSSSEDLSVERTEEVSSSSDSSLDNNNSFASHRRGSESGTPAPQDLSAREGDNNVKEEGKRGAFVDGDVDIVLGPSPVFKRMKKHDTDESMLRKEDGDIDNQQAEQVIQETNRNENNGNETGYSSPSNNERTTRTNENNAEEVTQMHEQHAEAARPSPKEVSPYRKNERVGSRERLDPRHMNNAMEHVNPKRMYHDRKNNARYRSTEAVGGDRDDWRGSYTSPANARSRSLADLSNGGGRGLSLVPGPEYSQSDMDKRFSYAGTGDTTFRNNRRDPYAMGSPIRDNLVENFHHFSPQSEDMTGGNSAYSGPMGRNDQRRRKNGNLPQSADEFDRTHTPQDDRNGNYSQRGQSTSARDISSLGTPPGINREEEAPRSHHMKNHLTAHQQQDQGRRNGKPPNYKPHGKYPSPSSSSLPRDMGHGYQHSVFNENGARSLPRGPSRGHEEQGYPDYHPTSRSLDRNRPYPSTSSDLGNNADRRYNSRASPADGRPRSPGQRVPRSRPTSHSSASPTEPSAPCHPARSNNTTTRPKPTPRRSVQNSSNANSHRHPPPRGVERQSTSAPLSVTNYVASPESGHVEVSDGDQAGRYPLAQLVFKTTNDDVFI